MNRALPLFAALLFAGCGSNPPQPDPVILTPPRTTVSPEPGPFNDRVFVTLTADKPSTIFYTVDGADPAAEGGARKSGTSPVALQLTATTTIRFFARSEEGLDETAQSAIFVRAGGVPGTIAGVVVVDTIAIGKAMAVTLNGVSRVPLNAVPTKSEVPFSIGGLDAGSYRLRALSDRNGDDQLTPFIDYASDVVTVELDFADPFKRSREDVRIYLGGSAPEFGTLKGTVTFSRPPAGQNLSIAALAPSALGAGADPGALLAELQSGYQIITNGTDTVYPYVITDLSPGAYMPVAIVTGLGNGGLAMNFQGNPLRSVQVAAGQLATRDFVFGGVGISGNATYDPTPDAGTLPDGGLAEADGGALGFAYGVVAAKTFNLTDGLQAVMMPTFFTPAAAAGQLSGGYGGTNFRENASFVLRAFPSTDAQNPLLASLGWVVATLGAAPPHAQVATGTTDVTVNFTF